MAVVFRILDQHLMRAHRSHAVVQAIAAASGIALDTVKRGGMHDRTSRPRLALRSGQVGDELQRCRRIGAKAAKGFRARRAVLAVVPGNHPRTGDRIFAKFHGS